MSAFQLKHIPDRFMGFELDVVELSEQLGNEDLIDTLMYQPASNESLLPYWGEVAYDFQSLSPTSKEIPDVSIWDISMLILTKKAYEALGEHLAEDGEFLPITANGQAMHVFNCLSFGAENTALCETSYLNGLEDGLKTLAFDEADINARMVFKSKLEGCNRLYASSAFKDLCEKFGLEGLRFDEDLISIF